MLTPSAEQCYVKGLHAMSSGRGREAMALFEAAIRIEWKSRVTAPQARYLSYFGLCLALERNENREALRFCRQAVTLEGYNPDIRCNLGRVLLNAGRRYAAHRCFLRGLASEPGHPAIRRALQAMGNRSRPTVPFLPRGNPVNVFLGRLRASAGRAGNGSRPAGR